MKPTMIPWMMQIMIIAICNTRLVSMPHMILAKRPITNARINPVLLAVKPKITLPYTIKSKISNPPAVLAM